jgi:hypothetical protein
MAAARIKRSGSGIFCTLELAKFGFGQSAASPRFGRGAGCGASLPCETLTSRIRSLSEPFGANLASAGTQTKYGARAMTITVAHLQPAISLIAGILILIMPRLLNYIVAIYLILAGLLGLGLLR